MRKQHSLELLRLGLGELVEQCGHELRHPVGSLVPHLLHNGRVASRQCRIDLLNAGERGLHLLKAFASAHGLKQSPDLASLANGWELFFVSPGLACRVVQELDAVLCGFLLGGIDNRIRLPPKVRNVLLERVGALPAVLSVLFAILPRRVCRLNWFLLDTFLLLDYRRF